MLNYKVNNMKIIKVYKLKLMKLSIFINLLFYVYGLGKSFLCLSNLVIFFFSVWFLFFSLWRDDLGCCSCFKCFLVNRCICVILLIWLFNFIIYIWSEFLFEGMGGIVKLLL